VEPSDNERSMFMCSEPYLSKRTFRVDNANESIIGFKGAINSDNGFVTQI
jgi:hypothetical protein